MDSQLFQQLHSEGLVSDLSFQKIKEAEGKKLFSLHWEIKTLLYLGVLLLSGGLGILVYKNIDSIGHQAILAFIAMLCVGCFFYCVKKKLPYSNHKVASPNAFFDYILLLGCLTFISFVAYIQFQYNVFGDRYGLATLFPMLVLFFSAYYFDHLGVLSMAITNFAAWMGITVTPLHILQSNDFDSSPIIITGLICAVILIAAGMVSARNKVKKHFDFTYTNFGMHLLFISCLAAMFHFDRIYLLWFLLLMGITYYFYTKAVTEKSFYILLISTLYGYIGLSYAVIECISNSRVWYEGLFYFVIFYFIGTSIGLAFFLIHSNKKIKGK